MASQYLGRDISRLMVRVENAIQLQRGGEFSSKRIADLLAVAQPEVLHILHLLKAVDRLELLPGDGHSFSDTWQVPQGTNYVFEEVKTVPISERHMSKDRLTSLNQQVMQ